MESFYHLQHLSHCDDEQDLVNHYHGEWKSNPAWLKGFAAYQHNSVAPSCHLRDHACSQSYFWRAKKWHFDLKVGSAVGSARSHDFGCE